MTCNEDELSTDTHSEFERGMVVVQRVAFPWYPHINKASQ